jgi:hypothetical protein
MAKGHNQHSIGWHRDTSAVPAPARPISEAAQVEYNKLMNCLPAHLRERGACNLICCECSELQAQLIRLHAIAETVEPFYESPTGPKPHPVFSTLATINARYVVLLTRLRLTPQIDNRVLQAQREREPEPMQTTQQGSWRDRLATSRDGLDS